MLEAGIKTVINKENELMVQYRKQTSGNSEEFKTVSVKVWVPSSKHWHDITDKCEEIQGIVDQMIANDLVGLEIQ